MRETKDEMNKGNLKRCCPYCRVPLPSSDIENMKRVKKRMQLNDAEAFHELATWYYHGNGVPQDHKKAFEFYSRGAELGSFHSHFVIAHAYRFGNGVENDEDKSIHHLMLAAIGGNEVARHMLGDMEKANGNMNTAMKHYMIAARGGVDDSLKMVGKGYKDGHVTKDQYANTLRTYKEATEAMRSCAFGRPQLESVRTI